MRTTLNWRLLAILLLLAGIFTAPAIRTAGDANFAVVAGQDDDGGDDGDDDGDDDREEEREEDAEEREEEREEREEEREERQEEREDERDDDEDDDSLNPVEPDAGYDVDVACVTADDAASTDCTVTGVAPATGEDVDSIVIPERALCVGVIDGERDYVDPDSDTNVTGYASRGNDGSLTLTLEGRVTTGGAATYWLTADNEVFPATGPGFFCEEPPTPATAEGTAPAGLEFTLDATPSATLESAPATGSILVSTYVCTGVPADTSAYDWYGACDAGGDYRFLIDPVAGDATDLHAAETSKTGEATFADLPPGRYDLDDVNANWCHAESDAVNADGDLTVEAGAETTVWLFYCQDANTS